MDERVFLSLGVSATESDLSLFFFLAMSAFRSTTYGRFGLTVCSLDSPPSGLSRRSNDWPARAFLRPHPFSVGLAPTGTRLDRYASATNLLVLFSCAAA